ncbi:hypothetical protein ER308_02130 [Egibacter rhizosphaerae]|uniref:SWIM-type domain-containing protein n=1 Tax=Egibacter rhizosphaerae TaxID=1670831 RepID=A0A411YB84_9ACTN|nr:hypothetical protein [Egibacter rhizosphaerae]QBI18481.1 hypothetical protein ER308_02130 [Egibacter rhizosphaerae]
MSARAWLSEVVLEVEAGPEVFARGEDYAERGLVELATVDDERIHATVHGTEPYQVELTRAGAEVPWSCTCPYASDGDVCKHEVAAGLAAIGQAASPRGSAREAATEAALEEDALRAWLATRAHDEVVALLLDAARDHPEVHRRLAVRVAADRGGPVDLAPFEAALAEAFDPGGFVHWRDMYEWTADAHAAIDSIAELADAGFADAVVDLAERGLAEVERAIGRVDDSGGQLDDLAERLVDLHQAALRDASVDRVAVAERLLALALSSELETLADRLGEYRDALGAHGWDGLCARIRAAWDALPAYGSGDDDRDRYGRRLRLEQLMEQLAGDDLDALLEIRGKTLARPFDWVRIMATCAEAGRDDLAVDWGERALAAFGPEADTRLTDALAEAYQRLGRLDAALELERAQFAGRPSATRYQRLRAVAEPLGRWEAEREEAYRIAHELATQAHEDRSQRPPSPLRGRTGWADAPGSLLVELHLADGDVEAAWTTAREHGATDAQWRRLADLRAAHAPDDAIDVYARELEAALRPADQRAYTHVAELLGALAPLHQRAGRADEFAALVTRIREEYKRRPNLIKTLDRAGLTA